MSTGVNLTVDRPEEYYTAAEAAKLLGINYHTLLSRAKRGVYISVKFGWAVMFPKEEIEKHVDPGPDEEPDGGLLLSLDKEPDGEMD